eukprot:CAMPEP_0197848732 /NCGR_PEP_ID=MMETSP1438-20131217/9821_1 /TAXON_ID=1461541 /ORGANISM="Pterosperma sp., Strain CCMP1384" /LENGTH=983 /DNA_ID=CAMNT_0043461119 /DNA_START=165 /DNA_END=3113 /DNA_ORIENTATION=+
MPNALPEGSNYVCPESVNYWMRQIHDEDQQSSMDHPEYEYLYGTTTVGRDVTIKRIDGKLIDNEIDMDKGWTINLQFECCVPDPELPYSIASSRIFPQEEENLIKDQCVVAHIKAKDLYDASREAVGCRVEPILFCDPKGQRGCSWKWPSDEDEDGNFDTDADYKLKFGEPDEEQQEVFDRERLHGFQRRDPCPHGYKHFLNKKMLSVKKKNLIPEGYVCPGTVDRINFRHPALIVTEKVPLFIDGVIKGWHASTQSNKEDLEAFPQRHEYKNMVYQKWGRLTQTWEDYRNPTYYWNQFDEPDEPWDADHGTGLGFEPVKFHIIQDGTDIEAVVSRGTDIEMMDQELSLFQFDGLHFECCKAEEVAEEVAPETSPVAEPEPMYAYDQLPVACNLGQMANPHRVQVAGEWAERYYERDPSGRVVKEGPTMTAKAQEVLGKEWDVFSVEDCSEACLSKEKKYDYFTLLNEVDDILGNLLFPGKRTYTQRSFDGKTVRGQLTAPLGTYCYCHNACHETMPEYTPRYDIGINKMSPDYEVGKKERSGNDMTRQSYVRHGVLDQVTVNVGFGDTNRQGEEVVVPAPEGYACPTYVNKYNWIGGWHHKETQANTKRLTEIYDYGMEMSRRKAQNGLALRIPEPADDIKEWFETNRVKAKYSAFSVNRVGNELRVKPAGLCGDYDNFGMMLSFKCTKTSNGVTPTKVPWTEHIANTYKYSKDKRSEFDDNGQLILDSEIAIIHEEISEYGKTWDPLNWMFLGCADHEGDFGDREYKGGIDGDFRQTFYDAQSWGASFVGVACQDSNCHENAHKFFFKSWDLSKLRPTGCKHGSGGHTCSREGAMHCGNSHAKNRDGGGGWAVYADMTKFRDQKKFDTLPDCLDVYYGSEQNFWQASNYDWGPHEDVCRKYLQAKAGRTFGIAPLTDSYCISGFAQDRTWSLNIPPGYQCPAQVDKSNWSGGYGYDDKFLVNQNGENIKVYRDGCNVPAAW